jgi:hypothetical protein
VGAQADLQIPLQFVKPFLQHPNKPALSFSSPHKMPGSPVASVMAVTVPPV